ncbi:NUMOD3 domain-containing DNA-binding protein, partial [Salmonella enterica]|uniref:NUMOD3 domain-containing DNA-binding protein n=1 Tax=Salmonella enterica TaxID=28901 RepID=UPI003CEDA050
MTIDATHTIRNNKMYEWIRTEYAKSQSIAYSGSGNPMFGKKHSKETKQMWSNKRKGSGNSMYGKKRPEVSKLMSELKRGPHW